MNANTDSPLDTPPPRPRRSIARRDHRASVQEPGACSLTPQEIGIVTQALWILENKVVRKLKPGEFLTSPQRVREWLTLHYGLLEREVFGLIFLDAKHRVLGHQQLFNGDLHNASVYPRQVVRSVMHFNASALVAVHCHPSQVCEASHADEAITRHLKNVLATLDVRLLDHLIVAGNQITSMAEQGRM